MLAAAVALGSALTLAGGCKPQRDPQRLIIGSRNRIDTVDPAGAYTFGAMQLLSAIGDPLYAITSDGRLEPRLATGLPQISDDGLRVQVTLRRGVRFHDGTAFDAAAMVFTLERFLAIGKLSYLLGDRVTAVRALGSHTIELRLKRPFGAMAQLLSAINLTPLSPTAYRHHRRRQWSDRFVGTGPYRLSFFTPSSSVWNRLPSTGGVPRPTGALTWWLWATPPPCSVPCRAARSMACSRPASSLTIRLRCSARPGAASCARPPVRRSRSGI